MKQHTQHTSPCIDCPWRRIALPGWLGGETAKEWIRHAHNDTVVDCHIHNKHQCAGLAIYRANMSKVPRQKKALRLPQDKANVFAHPDEFINHHEEKDCEEGKG